MMPYVIIIINGKGGCGKDTLIKEWKNKYQGVYDIFNYSTIDIIRKAASVLGYDPEDKSDKSRKFLSDLKRISTEYNDFPTTYILEQVKAMIPPDDGVMLKPRVLFVHCREPKEIDKLKKLIEQMARNLQYPGCVAKTLLVTSPRTDTRQYGNPSDDDVENYVYDYTVDNDLLSLAVNALHEYVRNIVQDLY